ncbi:MAG: excinuclease ABC subunit C [Terriglobia bacterium]|nr:excinuclease ABC subunit C [Terriglobia bacterium]
MLTHQAEFLPELDSEFLATLPAAPAVFLLRGEEAAADPYVSKTANLRRRMQRLLGPAEPGTKRLNLRERVRWLEYTPTSSDFESGFLLYKVLREAFPATYSKRLHLRPAPLVKLILENAFPRVTVTTRISRLKSQSVYYGPFPTRAAAEKFANDSLDFFKLRRCHEELQPDPSHPGCMYSEMKMCLAPCYKGCTDEEYRAETEQVHSYFDSNARSLLVQIATDRDAASERLDFETAAALHARHEKVAAVRAQLPEIIRRIGELRGVMVQPSTEAESVTLFKIEHGCLAAPVTLNVAARQIVTNAKTPTSMEARISEALATVADPEPHSAQEWMEHLALLKRWFYRTSKVGEAFFADEKGGLPMRRIVRGVSRVYKGETPQADLSETARDYWVNRGKEMLRPIDE